MCFYSAALYTVQSARALEPGVSIRRSAWSFTSWARCFISLHPLSSNRETKPSGRNMTLPDVPGLKGITARTQDQTEPPPGPLGLPGHYPISKMFHLQVLEVKQGALPQTPRSPGPSGSPHRKRFIATQTYIRPLLLFFSNSSNSTFRLHIFIRCSYFISS